MIEIDCVYNGLRQVMEIGETHDQYVIYCKSTKSMQWIISQLHTDLERFGLTFIILDTRVDVSGNIVKVQIYAD